MTPNLSLRRLLLLGGLILLFGTTNIPSFAAPSATTYTINLSIDDNDFNTNDNRCDTNPSIAGDQCTLRAAIEQANASSDKDTIAFRIGLVAPNAVTLTLDDPLPVISQSVIIDGRTQPQGIIIGLPPQTACAESADDTHNLLITVDGTNLTSGFGLQFSGTSDGSELYGMALVNFPNSAVYASTDDHTFACLHVGVQRDGVTQGSNASGIQIVGGKSIVIGGTTHALRNVISGNSFGINISGDSASNQVVGNFIGTDETGTLDVGNGSVGVRINSSDDNTIGGSGSSRRNVISGNGIGIYVFSRTSEDESRDTIIRDNYIGVDVSGAVALPNSRDGISIEKADGVEIGRFIINGSSNIISGNDDNGITIANSTNVNIFDNLIGTTATASDAIPNGEHGIEVDNSNTISIGDNRTANVISNNGQDGIYLHNSSSAVPIIGNTIHNNGGNGVTVVGIPTIGNIILTNSFFGNGGLGIDLGNDGITPNDFADNDIGPNELVNFPEISSYSWTSTTVQISGTIDVGIISDVVITVYVSSSCADSDREGEMVLGTINLSTAQDGTASFGAIIPVSTPAGSYLTTQLNNANGNNGSEFSQCLLLTSTPTAITLSSALSTSATTSSLLLLITGLIGASHLLFSRQKRS